MSSSGVEDLLTDGACMGEYTCIGGMVGGELYSLGLNYQGHTEVDQLAPWCYTPKPGAECRRTTMMQLDRSMCTMDPPYGVNYIFVQGKESACIVARDLGKGKGEDMDELRMTFIGWAVIGHRRISIVVDASEMPADKFTLAVVSVRLNPDDLNYEKESRPGSSHKDSSSKRVDEQAAIDFLMQKLENDTSEETIQTAIYALQCLYQENIKADEIEVYTAEGNGIGNFLPREEIEMHLAVINNATSSSALDRVGSSSWVVVRGVLPRLPSCN